MRVILDIAHMHLDKQMLGGNPDVALSLAGRWVLRPGSRADDTDDVMLDDVKGDTST